MPAVKIAVAITVQALAIAIIIETVARNLCQSWALSAFEVITIRLVRYIEALCTGNLLCAARKVTISISIQYKAITIFVVEVTKDFCLSFEKALTLAVAIPHLMGHAGPVPGGGFATQTDTITIGVSRAGRLICTRVMGGVLIIAIIRWQTVYTAGVSLPTIFASAGVCSPFGILANITGWDPRNIRYEEPISIIINVGDIQELLRTNDDFDLLTKAIVPSAHPT